MSVTKNKIRKVLLWSTLFVFVLGGSLVLGKYLMYRFNFGITHLPHDTMLPAPIETYTDKAFYDYGDTVRFHLHSEVTSGQLQIEKILSGYRFDSILVYDFGVSEQDASEDLAENGCDWKVNYSVVIDERFSPGYYRTRLFAKDSSVDESYSVFLVGDGMADKEVVIFAPVSTWNAYNKYGGKSLYVSFPELGPVYYVSNQRPNPNLRFDISKVGTDVPVEANVFEWFASEYETVVLPDYFLELPDRIPKARVYVLSGHCEYFSDKMYDQLEQSVEDGISLISMGGNQLYWKIRWNEDFTQMECRKDLSFFSWSAPGGKWRHTFRYEEELLGVHYDERGMGTYAPYKVENADHWVFEGLSLKGGDIFGESGMNSLGLSGNETDKRSGQTPDSFTLLAHGLNRASSEGDADMYWTAGNAGWDGSGGAEMVIRELDNGAGIFASGSIQSGSGLGYDPVMTGIVKNFVDRYVSKAGN